MPYDVLSKVGLPTGILIVMAVLMWEWVKNSKQIHEDHKKFVSEVIEKCDKREEKSDKRESELMAQLDKYNDSLHEISENIKAIPQMQSDIAYLKGKVSK